MEDGEQQKIATIDLNDSLPRTWHAMISSHPTTVVYFTIQFNHSFQVIACVLEEEERGTATVDIANSLVVNFVPLYPSVIVHEFKATNTFKSQPSWIVILNCPLTIKYSSSFLVIVNRLMSELAFMKSIKITLMSSYMYWNQESNTKYCYSSMIASTIDP